MEDDFIIKAGIAKLNGSNYRTWAAITRAVIEAKDAWETIEPMPAPKTEASVKDTDDVKVSPGEAIESKAPAIDRAKDVKTRTVIMGYCDQEALSRILHLRTAKEQWEELEHIYLLLGRQQLSTKPTQFYGYTSKPGTSVNSIVTSLHEARMDIFNIDPKQ